MIRVPVCARVSRVCPGSPRCLFTGTVIPVSIPCVSRLAPGRCFEPVGTTVVSRGSLRSCPGTTFSTVSWCLLGSGNRKLRLTAVSQLAKFSPYHRVTRPLRGSVSCGSGWSVPCVSIQLTLSQSFHFDTRGHRTVHTRPPECGKARRIRCCRVEVGRGPSGIGLGGRVAGSRRARNMCL